VRLKTCSDRELELKHELAKRPDSPFGRRTSSKECTSSTRVPTVIDPRCCIHLIHQLHRRLDFDPTKRGVRRGCRRKPILGRLRVQTLARLVVLVIVGGTFDRCILPILRGRRRTQSQRSCEIATRFFKGDSVRCASCSTLDAAPIDWRGRTARHGLLLSPTLRTSLLCSAGFSTQQSSAERSGLRGFDFICLGEAL